MVYRKPFVYHERYFSDRGGGACIARSHKKEEKE